MDNLRLILLGIGVLFILGIYVWEISRREKKSKPQETLSSGFPTSSFGSDVIEDYDVNVAQEKEIEANDDYADLGAMLTQERNQILNKSSIEEEPITSFYDDDEIESISSELAGENDVAQNNANSDAKNVLVLYIKARYERVISGMEIKRAAKECNLVYGDKRIFHYFGITNPDVNAVPLFSMANLFEPGEFDMEKMHQLRTKGLVMFMYPPAKDAFQTFERFISTVQRLAASIGAEIHKYDHTALTKWDIDQLRKNYYQ